MSKLYDQYLVLKKENPKTIYLFKSGIFYLLLEEDAKIGSEMFNLKQTHLNETVIKCGFPLGSLNKYLDLFQNNNLKVKIVGEEKDEYSQNKRLMNLLRKIKKEDINKMNGLTALHYISELKELL